MGSTSLTTAVLGLGPSGQRLLQAAAGTGSFLIRAVADQDQQKAEKTAAEYACKAYSDYRRLIVQNQFDSLLVAAETHSCAEQLKAALRKKFNILKLAPPARTFEEALEYAQLAEREKVQFAVANPARYRPSYATARELLAQGRLEHVFLVAARCRIGAVDRPAWQTDPKLAGGGVLLHDCYQIVDQILGSFPIPEQVYALTANQAPDKQQRLYLTEDTALVSMKFTDALMGSLVATRRNEIGPSRVALEIHGKDARLTVTDNEVTFSAGADQSDQRWQHDEDEQVVTGRLLADFARSLLSAGEYEFTSGAAENLKNMAVLESAYLSARTGFPEEPARILQLAGNAPGAATGI
jgi:predicted dehydrogenase